MRFVNFVVFPMLVVISACNSEAPSASNAESTPAPIAETPTLLDGTFCYLYQFNQDTTAVQLTLANNQVAGYFEWQPYEKDGAHGMLMGTREGDIITAKFTYFIEGNIQAEEVMFKLQGDQLTQASNELEEVDGVLVIKDKTNLNWKDVFQKVNCSVVERQIANAQRASDAIIEQSN